ncbi:SRPBCC family protein [[Pantoea] beijingensis]|uniref:SRPBCC family protein n=1 Tax=[Pantoea] beijingensis TaxID=1324864 RepID=UPI000FE2D904|nr:SRPBCC family protein [[Pantoea] beijingensis]
MKYTQANSVICNAPQATVYSLICNSQQWPQLFEPCIAVETLARNEREEQIRVTALVGGEQMTWESRRVFRKEIYGIDSTIVKPMLFVKNMSTTWRVIALNQTQSLIVLEHDYTLVDEVPEHLDEVTTREQAATFVANAIEANSTKELGNIRDAVQRPDSVAQRSTSHSIICEASAAEVYGTIADVSNWPKIFDACISAVVQERAGNAECVRIEAWQNGLAVGWDTQRSYFDDIFRIDFFLPVPMPFLKEMSGQWRVIPLDERRCILNVTRDFALLDDISDIRVDITTHEQASELINRFIDDNAGSEMLAVKEFVEKKDTTLSSFTTHYSLPFAPEEFYSLLSDIRQWPDILPHCNDVKVIYEDTKYQEFVMEIIGAGGNEHFRSIRQCDRDTLTISYFQPEPPAMLKTHSGRWLARATANGTELIAEHSVHIDPERCGVLFSDDDIQRNKQRIKALIMKNSQATVDACCHWLLNRRAA